MTDQERRELGEALVRVTEERQRFRLAWLSARYRAASTIQHWSSVTRYLSSVAETRAAERDEARDEVVRLGPNLESERSAFREERESLNAEVVRLGRELERADEVIASMRSAIDKADAAEGDADRLDDLLGEARQQIIRDAKELVRLRTIIGELGAAEAAEPPTDDVEQMLRRASDQMLADLERTVDVEADLAALKERAKTWRPMTDEEIEALRPGGAE